MISKKSVLDENVTITLRIAIIANTTPNIFRIVPRFFTALVSSLWVFLVPSEESVLLRFPPLIFVEYDKPVPGADTRARAPVRELNDIPPYLPPMLIPTDFLPTLILTPGAILILFLNRVPTNISPYEFL